MDIWQSIPGMLFRFVLILWKKMLSLRAGGTSFDPEIKGQDGRTYLVFLNLQPGYDEVVFTRLQAKGCDIADAKAVQGDSIIPDYVPKGEWTHDAIPLRIVVPPKSRGEPVASYPVMIRPRSEVDHVKFVLTGGILNRLSATRTLLD